MKTTNQCFKLSALTFVLFSTIHIYSQSVASYDVVFTSVWNATDHGSLPGNPHWSRLVGANHNGQVSFLSLGALATPGIQDVAEKGVNDMFQTEVTTSITAGNAEQYFFGSNLASATGTISLLDIDIDENYPLLTLVSMIAPSPDWMIAISSIDLRETGDWISSKTIDLYPYDAGTDSGTSYSAANLETTPHVAISSLQGVAPFNNEKIGSMTISLKSVLSVTDHHLTSSFKLYPNPSSENFIRIKAVKPGASLSYEIVNFTGQSMVSASLTNAEIDISKLSSGLYFFIMKHGNSKTIKKFIKL